MAYTYDPIFAADPNNPAMVAKDAVITIFDPADVTKAPVTITDPTGSPLPNPITVNANGFGPAFQHATLDRVGWSGGGFSNYFSSYEGMKAVATAAQSAAGASATSSAASATSSAASAALVGAPADVAMQTLINASGSATRGALNSTFVPRWKANTAYLAGDAVLNPSGDTVTAKANFTSGASYSAANWNLSASYVDKTSLRDSQLVASRNSVALRHARLALGDRNDNPFDTMHLGDSITAGYTVSARSKRWTSVLLDEMRRRYPTTGVVGGLGFLTTKTEGNSSVTYPDNAVTYSGGSEAGYPGFGLDLKARVLSGAGNTITWAFTGTGFDIDWTSYSGGGSFTWAVDGGAASSPISTSTGGAIDVGSNTTQVRGLTAGAHSIAVAQSAGGTVYINGGFAYNGDETKGIRGTTLATLGWTSGNWWGSNASQRYWVDSVAKRSPDLVTIALGANDFGSNGSGDGGPRTPAAYKANLKSIIAAIKGKTTGYVPSFILMPYWTMGTGITPLAPYSDYVTAQYEVAAEDPNGAVAVFDFQQRVNPGAPGTADGFLPDNTHPIDPGNRALAEWIADLFAAA